MDRNTEVPFLRHSVLGSMKDCSIKNYTKHDQHTYNKQNHTKQSKEIKSDHETRDEISYHISKRLTSSDVNKARRYKAKTKAKTRLRPRPNPKILALRPRPNITGCSGK